MARLTRTSTKVWSILAAMLALVTIGSMGRAMADNGTANNPQHMVTIYDRGAEQTIITKAGTIREALAQARVDVAANDLVEPGLNEQLVADHYNVNVYRARPVIVEDGQTRVRTITAAQSPAKIAKAANVTLYAEDTTKMSRVDDVVNDGGAGLKLTIDRATPFSFVLYGKRLDTTRTQASTVGAMLKEKRVTLGPKDGTSLPLSAPIVAGMSVEVWRNGVQTMTQEEDIPMPTEQVKDQDRAIGFKEVRTTGKPGKKQVTYEINTQNGKEISRKIIQEVQTLAPVKQVEVVGAKLPTPTNPSEAQVLGHQMMLNFGFGDDQWPCLSNLWMHESGWKTTAGNASSGAYGIPQALPGSKMGSGWQNDASVQIQWGLGYIKDRYQTPCGAYAHWQSYNWY